LPDFKGVLARSPVFFLCPEIIAQCEPEGLALHQKRLHTQARSDALTHAACFIGVAERANAQAITITDEFGMDFLLQPLQFVLHVFAEIVGVVGRIKGAKLQKYATDWQGGRSCC
jgi:hypothetical protein